MLLVTQSGIVTLALQGRWTYFEMVSLALS